jgi:hypothetical protein
MLRERHNDFTRTDAQCDLTIGNALLDPYACESALNNYI